MDKRQDRVVEVRTGAEDLRRLGLVDRAELQDRLADELQRRLDQPAVRPTEPEVWTMTESQRRQIAEELAILRQLEDAARLAPDHVLEQLAVLADESASPVAERGDHDDERAEIAATLPRQEGYLRKWKQVWKRYGPSWTEGSDLGTIADSIRRHNYNRHIELPAGEDTLRKIFRAGAAGLLD